MQGQELGTIWLGDESTINEIRASKHALCSRTPRVDNIFNKTWKVVTNFHKQVGICLLGLSLETLVCGRGVTLYMFLLMMLLVLYDWSAMLIFKGKFLYFLFNLIWETVLSMAYFAFDFR